MDSHYTPFECRLALRTMSRHVLIDVGAAGFGVFLDTGSYGPLCLTNVCCLALGAGDFVDHIFSEEGSRSFCGLACDAIGWTLWLLILWPELPCQWPFRGEDYPNPFIHARSFA